MKTHRHRDRGGRAWTGRVEGLRDECLKYIELYFFNYRSWWTHSAFLTRKKRLVRVRMGPDREVRARERGARRREDEDEDEDDVARGVDVDAETSGADDDGGERGKSPRRRRRGETRVRTAGENVRDGRGG